MYDNIAARPAQDTPVGTCADPFDAPAVAEAEVLLKTVADGVSDEEEGGAVAVEDDEAEDEDEDEDIVDELEPEVEVEAEVLLPAAALLVLEVVVLADTLAEVTTVDEGSATDAGSVETERLVPTELVPCGSFGLSISKIGPQLLLEPTTVLQP